MTTSGLYLWQQNTLYFSVFLIESAQHVMLYLWQWLRICLWILKFESLINTPTVTSQHTTRVQ